MAAPFDPVSATGQDPAVDALKHGMLDADGNEPVLSRLWWLRYWCARHRDAGLDLVALLVEGVMDWLD